MLWCFLHGRALALDLLESEILSVVRGIINRAVHVTDQLLCSWIIYPLSLLKDSLRMFSFLRFQEHQIFWVPCHSGDWLYSFSTEAGLSTITEPLVGLEKYLALRIFRGGVLVYCQAHECRGIVIARLSVQRRIGDQVLFWLLILRREKIFLVLLSIALHEAEFGILRQVRFRLWLLLPVLALRLLQDCDLIVGELRRTRGSWLIITKVPRHQLTAEDTKPLSVWSITKLDLFTSCSHHVWSYHSVLLNVTQWTSVTHVWQEVVWYVQCNSFTLLELLAWLPGSYLTFPEPKYWRVADGGLCLESVLVLLFIFLYDKLDQSLVYSWEIANLVCITLWNVSWVAEHKPQVAPDYHDHDQFVKRYVNIGPPRDELILDNNFNKNEAVVSQQEARHDERRGKYFRARFPFDLLLYSGFVYSFEELICPLRYVEFTWYSFFHYIAIQVIIINITLN